MLEVSGWNYSTQARSNQLGWSRLGRRECRALVEDRATEQKGQGKNRKRGWGRVEEESGGGEWRMQDEGEEEREMVFCYGFGDEDRSE